MKFFIVVFLIAGIALITKAQQTLTLRECVNQAIDRNLQLQKQQLTVDMLVNQLDMAKYDRLPEVNSSIGSGLYFGRFFSYDKSAYVNDRDTYVNADVSTNVVLFSGMQKAYRIEQSSKNVETNEANYKSMVNDLTLEIVNNYLQIIYNREQAEALVQQLDVTFEQIKRTTQLAKAGSVPQGDVLELKAQAANEKSQITSYRNLERQALTSLRQAMNIMQDSFDIVVPGDFNVDSLYLNVPPKNEIYNTAIGFLPEIKAAEATKQSKKVGIDLAKAAYYPTVNLHASLSTQYRELAADPNNPTLSYSFSDQMVDNTNSILGVSINIPIFNKFQTRYRVQNAEIDYQLADKDLLLTKQNIFKTIETAVNEAKAAYDNYKAAQENVSASKESFRYAEQKFNAGLMNSVDYNLAKSNLINAEASMVSARYELLFRVKIIDFYQGEEIEL